MSPTQMDGNDYIPLETATARQLSEDNDGVDSDDNSYTPPDIFAQTQAPLDHVGYSTHSGCNFIDWAAHWNLTATHGVTYAPPSYI